MTAWNEQPPAASPDIAAPVPIEELTVADLLEAVAGSIAGARSYLGPAVDDTAIALGDCIDALDNLLVVVKRLAAGVQS